MLDVFFTTISKVSVLLIFIAAGYLLRRIKKLPENTGTVLSLLTTLIFSPAYSIRNLATSLTMDKIGSQSLLIGYGLLCVLLTIGFSWLVTRIDAMMITDTRSRYIANFITCRSSLTKPRYAIRFGSDFPVEIILVMIGRMIHLRIPLKPTIPMQENRTIASRLT
jgi:hypothetical protein